MEIDNKILIPHIAEQVKKGFTVTLPLRGMSMRPYLEDDRDKALLSSPPRTLRVGDVILAEISPEKWAMHRIVSIEDDIITMYGDGNFSPEYVERGDVVAIALGFYRKGRQELETVDSFWYTVYWHLWVTLRPIRRLLLLLWKIKHYPSDTMRKIKQKIFR